jgi:hypothetical protein
VKFVTDRMSFITLRGLWFDIIVLNVYSINEDKIYDTKDGFYDELERAFD